MRSEELAFAIDLAAQEGWNPGLHDAECFSAADPDGFLIGELAGEAVGCISAVSYGGRYGFIGLYIVRPEFRGRGYGRRVWQAAMARLRGHNVGLDGVVAQQGNYARSGFRLAYRNVRHRGKAEPAAMHASIRPADDAAHGAIADYDRRIFPERRDVFLRHWLAQPMAGAYVAREGRVLTGIRWSGGAAKAGRSAPWPQMIQSLPDVFTMQLPHTLQLARRFLSTCRKPTRARRRPDRPQSRSRIRDRPNVHELGPGDRTREALRGDDARTGMRSNKKTAGTREQREVKRPPPRFVWWFTGRDVC